MRQYSKWKFKRSYFKGFTLIELMVTVAIFAFMTALVMARYNNFYSGTIFKNLAYDVALTIRQAQTYGVSVKAGNNANNFNNAFGVYFNRIGNVNQKKFSLYSYTNSNNASTIEKTFNLKNRAYIFLLRAGTGSTADTTMNTVDIIFRRPNPDAIICGTNTATGLRSCDIYKSAEIRLRSTPTSTKYMYIRVNSVGQIRVSET